MITFTPLWAFCRLTRNERQTSENMSQQNNELPNSIHLGLIIQSYTEILALALKLNLTTKIIFLSIDYQGSYLPKGTLRFAAEDCYSHQFNWLYKSYLPRSIKPYKNTITRLKIMGPTSGGCTWADHMPGPRIHFIGKFF